MGISDTSAVRSRRGGVDHGHRAAFLVWTLVVLALAVVAVILSWRAQRRHDRSDRASGLTGMRT